MKTKIAFYKGKGGIFDKIIRWYTKSIYSHCEIILGTLSFSSSCRDNGVRVKYIEYNDINWDYNTVDIDINKLFLVFNQHNGKGYDYTGILFSHIIPVGIDNKSKVYCSEFCAEVLGIETCVTPQELYDKTKDRKWR